MATIIPNYWLNGLVLRMTLAFGLAFETPIATFALAWSGLVAVETLSSVRPYVFLGAFVVGMLMTPPDMISQTMLALPMYALYEAGIILARLFPRGRQASTGSALPT